jgi:DNA-nicking Smr family endonuclease
VSDDDREIFRRAMRDARPIRGEPRASGGQPRPKPRARFHREDEKAALLESLDVDADSLAANAGDALRFQRPSVGRRVMRQLARGSYAVQGELDLHGLTLAEARPRLDAFLEDAVRNGKRCVRIVHGKGLGSGPRGAVLKPNVDRWLRRRETVLAFVSTRQVDGGTGAVYVLLRDR